MKSIGEGINSITLFIKANKYFVITMFDLAIMIAFIATKLLYMFIVSQHSYQGIILANRSIGF